MSQEIILGHRKIGLNHPPFIIAEMSGNHNQSLDRALEIVDAAAKTGVHAMKIQTYTADTMTLNLKTEHFMVNDKNSLWKGKSLYDLYQEAHTPWDWHKAIFDRCKKHGIIGFSTPFDDSAVDFLESLNVPFYKVASFENTDLRLLKKVASTKKPMIISTGMATVSDLQDMVSTVRAAGGKDIILLKCTSSYPSSPIDSNVRTIPHLRELFGTEVGLSDHTMGVGVAVASVALGATVIEKHFTLKRSDGGVDSAFSLEPHELESLVVETQRAWEGLGAVSYGISEKEKASLIFRRSLFVVKDIGAGEVLTAQHIRSIRPGYGSPIKFYDLFLGKKVSKPVKAGTPLTWDLIG